MTGTYRFAGFELHEARRELKLGDREIVLQPRVFDFLVYLIRHRDRIVAKDELLEALWPGSVVVDGALQRVVSLARSALQEGDARSAIRTYPRHGYRFCASLLECTSPPAAETPASDGTLSAGHAYDRHAWEEAISLYAAADAPDGLDADDLERWALAARWAGRAEEALAPLERSLTSHLAAGRAVDAARAALGLAEIRFERMDFALATAWHRRSRALLANADDCRERGLWHYLAARIALLDGRFETAVAEAVEALEMGKRLGDRDLEALGLIYRGHGYLALGEVEQGVDCQDQAATLVLTDTVTAWVGGVVYCSIVWACRNRSDWDRAAQWTDQFQSWCDRNRLAAFPGTCRLHRAEVLGIRGEIRQAQVEILETCDLLARWAPWAEGDAYRVLGDLNRFSGKLEDAELAYQRAYERGWDPQPGLALLQVARGRPQAAVHALQRSLSDSNWANRERRGALLVALAIAATAAGLPETAQKAVEELQSKPNLCSAPVMTAALLQCRAELAAGRGDVADGIILARRALGAWQEAGAPLHAAHLRIRLAELLVQDGDESTASLELRAARAFFREVAAEALVARCDALSKSLGGD